MEKLIIELVNSNSRKIDQLKENRILSVSVGKMKKQNSISARSGGPILINYVNNGVACTTSIWAKSIKSPRKAYQAQERAYSSAEQHGISQPIPKPYFYDENINLVFMEMKTGNNLLGLTLRYSFFLNLLPNDDIRTLFFEIGAWLQKFHASVETGEKIKLKTVIEDVDSELKNTKSFSLLEKNSISDILKCLSDRKISEQEFPLITPHNDFTLRNLFMQQEGKFNIIDWDAMIHPCFPKKALCWWDLTTLIINLQSMLKIEPLIESSRIRTLCNAIISGYYYENEAVNTSTAEDFFQCIYYIYTLKYWLGIDSDRPLWEIYGTSRGMGHRYVAKLRQMLLTGKADICSA